jgi:hypothetical protein
MQTGRMLNYLFCFPTLNQRVRSIFDNHFEITIQEERPRSFHFLVTRKDYSIYKAEHTYHSRKACLEDVEHLRRLAGEGESYQIDSRGGTFTIEIKDKKDKCYCSTVSKLSKADAEVLKEESIDYIPHCRLS